MRELFARGTAGAEPPLGTLFGDVLRAGFRARRRRRVLTAGGALSVTAVLAISVAAGFRYAPQAARPRLASPASHPVVQSTMIAPGARLPGWFHFAIPRAANLRWARPLAPTTAKSATRLLLDDLAGGTRVSGLRATLKELGSEAGAQANLKDPAGTGSAEMQMSRPGNAQPSECAGVSGLLACRSYLMPDGTRVQESLRQSVTSAGGGSDRHRYVITVVMWRPHHGVSATFAAMDYFVNGHSTGFGAPPVTMARLASAAVDPRWGFSMNRGFVAGAEHLRLGGDSGQVWH